MAQHEDAPELSVIVTLVEGGQALTRCLDALLAQSSPPRMEILVPYDDSVAHVGALESDYPHVRFLPLGALAAGQPRSAFEEHELFDRRRAGGLRHARGRLLAMLEDRGWPRADWARRMVDAHARFPDAAIGGAIEGAAGDGLRWAAFICDFGRFQAPLDVADAAYVSDINICYKREPLERVRDVWRERYQETLVNDALRASGERLRLSDEPVVVQERGPISFPRMAAERLHWARVFAQARGRHAGRGLRLAWIAATPALPLLLYARHARREVRAGRDAYRFARTTPVMLALLALWSLGELIGYCEVLQAPRAPAARPAARSPRGMP